MIRFSTRGEYGTKAMLDLALHYGKGPILLKEVAQRQEIPPKYLEQLITPLRLAGLVRSIRGPRGGYLLTRAPSRIKMREIVQVLEGSLSLRKCIDNPQGCNHASLCATRDVWKELKEKMEQILESTSLADLIRRGKEKGNLKG